MKKMVNIAINNKDVSIQFIYYEIILKKTKIK